MEKEVRTKSKLNESELFNLNVLEIIKNNREELIESFYKEFKNKLIAGILSMEYFQYKFILEVPKNCYGIYSKYILSSIYDRIADTLDNYNNEINNLTFCLVFRENDSRPYWAKDDLLENIDYNQSKLELEIQIIVEE